MMTITTDRTPPAAGAAAPIAALDRNRSAYAGLADVLERAGLAEHALYLNWGYQPVDGQPDWAARELPPGELGRMQARLVLEVLGDTPLDGRRVLDVGCGRGGALALMGRLHAPAALAGADISAANIAYCRKRHTHPRLRFQIADACRLPYPDSSMDVVFNLESSGAYPDIGAFFHHVHRILRVGGRFCLADVFDADSVAWVRAALEQAGFTLERERSIPAQVRAARERASPGIWRRLDTALTALDAPGLRRELERYLAAPSSGLFQALEDGRVDYRLFHWRKTRPAAGRIDADVIARLATRSARLDAALQDRAPSAAAPQSPAPGPANASASAWFPFTAPDAQAGFNVFALPYAGGGASVYRAWTLPRRPGAAPWQLCPVQLPGRESRFGEPLIDDMATLADRLADAIGPYAHRPWALLGCSLGCKIAFEVARRFARQGRPPALLFLMACPAPGLPLGRRISTRAEADFAREVCHLGGTPPEVLADAEMMRTLMPILRNDSALAEHYVAAEDATVNVPIVMVAAGDDHLVTVEEARRWQRHAGAGFDWRLVDGGHFFLRQRRRELTDWLLDALRRGERTLPVQTTTADVPDVPCSTPEQPRDPSRMPAPGASANLVLAPGEILVVTAPRSLAARLTPAALSDDEQRQLARFAFDADRERYLAAHWAKRRVLGALLAAAPRSLRFGAEAGGKPYLIGEALHFSLSHSGDRVAVAVCRHAPVGVDIEQARGIACHASAARIMHPLDRIAPQCETPEDRFLAAWSLKEAVAKCTGTGLALPFDSLRLAFAGNGRYGCHLGTQAAWEAHHQHEDGVHLAVASATPWAALRILPLDAALAEG
ncbi:thioesterase domain-containing protein [Ralstonia pseudosolanacearum]|uniref:thioesterase domain-containing protein n=1 Tax=Ralstonia pseudosolanacearum TaxID=1310165 RepID=UPI003AABF8B4